METPVKKIHSFYIRDLYVTIILSQSLNQNKVWLLYLFIISFFDMIASWATMKIKTEKKLASKTE